MSYCQDLQSFKHKTTIVLNVDAVLYNEAIAFLSPAECIFLERFTNFQRRVEWIISRVLLKFTYLEQKESQSNQHLSWRWVSWNEITSIMTPGISHLIEVTKENNDVKGPPIIVDKRTGGNCHAISLSHKWPFIIAACFVETSFTGIDIECIHKVSQAFRSFYFRNDLDIFYRLNGEKQDIDEDRLITLLWVLKESFIKTGASSANDVHDIIIVPQMIPDIVRTSVINSHFTEKLGVEVRWRGARYRGAADLYLPSNKHIASRITIW